MFNMCVRSFVHQLQLRFQVVYEETVTEGSDNAALPFKSMVLPGLGGPDSSIGFNDFNGPKDSGIGRWMVRYTSRPTDNTDAT